MERIAEVTYGEGGYDPQADDDNVAEVYIHTIENGVIASSVEATVNSDGEVIDPVTGEVFAG